MGDVEILLNEEGQLKVVQHYDLRVVLRRVGIEGLERHRAAPCLNCSPTGSTDNESAVFLKAMFVGSLGLAVIRFCVELGSTGGASWPGFVTSLLWLLALVLMGIVLLAIFVGVAMVCGVDKVMPTMMLKMKMKMKNTKQQRKEEVKTISGLIQHV